jgi:hypothetical protein
MVCLADGFRSTRGKYKIRAIALSPEVRPDRGIDAKLHQGDIRPRKVNDVSTLPFYFEAIVFSPQFSVRISMSIQSSTNRTAVPGHMAGFGGNAGFSNLAISALAEGRGVRPALLAALTDLFVSRDDPDGEEINRFEDMVLQLLPDADAATRAHVAARLAAHPSAPIAVIDALLQADRACATILIEHCPRISQETLLDLASFGNEAEAAVLARRKKIDADIIDILSMRSETSVLCALADNPDAVQDQKVLARLIEAARTSDVIASILCKRVGDSRKITPLFLHASAAQRAEILRDAELASFTSSQLRRVATANPILIDWIIERGKKGLWGLVAQEIVRLTGFTRTTVDKMLRDPLGDGIAILLAAIGCPATKAIRLFLSCPPTISYSYDRVKALARVVDHMPAHAAYGLVHAIIGTPMETARPIHVPLSDPFAKEIPGRARTGLSAAKLPAPRQQRGNLRLQR